jgi:hypothetical protein
MTRFARTTYLSFADESQVRIRTDGQLGGRASEIFGKPSGILGKPSEILGKPSEILGKPSEILGKPSEILGKPSEDQIQAARISGRFKEGRRPSLPSK